MVRKSLSLCVCVCVCVCIHTCICTYPRVFARLSSGAKSSFLCVPRGKVGERSRFCSLFLIDRLWSLAPKKRPRNKSRKLSSFFRSCCSPSLTCVPSLFSFSLSKNPIQSNPIIQKTGGSEQKSFTGEAEKVQLEHPQARHGGHQLLDER